MLENRDWDFSGNLVELLKKRKTKIQNINDTLVGP